MNTNVDVVNVDGRVAHANVAQDSAANLMPEGGYAAGWRIRPTAGQGGGWSGPGEISEQAVERINASDAIIKAHADPTWARTSTAVPFGSQIIDNDGRQAEVRSAWLRDTTPALPRLETIAARIAAEERADITLPLRSININDAGSWYLGDDVDGAVPMTWTAWKGLMAQAGSAKGWLDGMRTAPTERTIDNWRKYQSTYAPDKNVRAGVRTIPDEHGQPTDQLYRVVSEAFSDDSMSADQLVNLLADTLRTTPGCEDYRAKAVYNPESTGITIDITRHAPTIPGMGAGDVYQTGFRFSTGDVGSKGLTVKAIVVRNLCVNIMVIAVEDIAKVMITHRAGNEAKARAELVRVFGVAHKIGEAFVPLWTGAGVRKVADLFPYVKAVDDFDGMRKVYEAVANMRAMRKVTSAIAKDVAVEAMLLGYQREPGATLQSIINGATRVHEGLVPLERVPLFEEAAMPLMMELAR
jgi:hypothetical protein